MFNRKKRQMPNPFFPDQGIMPPGMMPQGMMQYPYEQAPENMPQNYEIAKIQTEISELNRRIGELLKRIVRLENYLGIRGELANEFEQKY